MVFFLELLEPARFAHAQPAVLLRPVIERRLREPHLAADLLGTSAGLGLLDRERDLLVGVFRLLQGPFPPPLSVIEMAGFLQF